MTPSHGWFMGWFILRFTTSWPYGHTLGIPWDSLRSEKRISCYTRSVDEQAPRCIHIYHHISYIPTFEPQVGQEFNIKNAKVNYGNWIKRNIWPMFCIFWLTEVPFWFKGRFFDFGYAWYFSTVCLYSRSGPFYMLILRGEGVTAADFNALNMRVQPSRNSLVAQSAVRAKATSFTRRSGDRSQNPVLLWSTESTV